MIKELISQNELKNKTVVVLGKFESLHKGHMKLFLRAAEISRSEDASAVVYMIKDPYSLDLITHAQKVDIAKAVGIDAFFTDELTDEFKHIMPYDFVKDILFKTLNACHVVVGYNFTFGYKRSGTAKVLKELCAEFGIEVTVIDCVCADIGEENIPISTTDIRGRLSRGEVESVSELLGRPYCVTGVVTLGKHLGSTLGFPTANLVFDEGDVLLKKGVYVTNTVFEGTSFKSITNVGFNPTVDKKDGTVKIETYVLDFQSDLYGKEIKVEFISYLREEKAFENIDKLKEQLALDIEKARSEN